MENENDVNDVLRELEDSLVNAASPSNLASAVVFCVHTLMDRLQDKVDAAVSQEVESQLQVKLQDEVKRVVRDELNKTFIAKDEKGQEINISLKHATRCAYKLVKKHEVCAYALYLITICVYHPMVVC
jgi:uncharacterized membrane protein YhiD involved in acid resistance